jgi:hypothetical protein
VISRGLLILAAATTAAAAFAPAAHAYSASFTFATQTGAGAQVDFDGPFVATRLAIERGGVEIIDEAGEQLTLGTLKAGDVARAYASNGTSVTATYDGKPAIATDACVGRSSFTAVRTAGADVVDAGAFRPLPGGAAPVLADWTQDESFVVTLERPLAVGDVAYAETEVLQGAILIRSYRGAPVPPCMEYAPPPKPPVGPPGPVPQTPSPLTPTAAEAQQALRASLSASGSGLRPLTPAKLARKSTLTLPFAFPEPGTIELRLTAKGKLLGTASKTSPVNGKVATTLRLTSAGRALLKRSKRNLKVTLDGTFTPSRAGAAPQRAGASLTLRAKKR